LDRNSPGTIPDLMASANVGYACVECNRRDASV
jgi:hypothetical protein